MTYFYKFLFALTVFLWLCPTNAAHAQGMNDIIEQRNEHKSGGGMKTLSFKGAEESSTETPPKTEAKKEPAVEPTDAEAAKEQLSEEDQKLSDKELWEKYKALSQKGEKLKEMKAERIAKEQAQATEKAEDKEETSTATSDAQDESEERTAHYDDDKSKNNSAEKSTSNEDRILQEIVQEYKSLNDSQGPMHSRSYGGLD